MIHAHEELCVYLSLPVSVRPQPLLSISLHPSVLCLYHPIPVVSLTYLQSLSRHSAHPSSPCVITLVVCDVLPTAKQCSASSFQHNSNIRQLLGLQGTCTAKHLLESSPFSSKPFTEQLNEFSCL